MLELSSCTVAETATHPTLHVPRDLLSFHSTCSLSTRLALAPRDLLQHAHVFLWVGQIRQVNYSPAVLRAPPRGRMASKKAQKQELMRVLDAGVKELREEISKKLEAFSSPIQDSACSSRSLQPGILIGS